MGGQQGSISRILRKGTWKKVTREGARPAVEECFVFLSWNTDEGWMGDCLAALLQDRQTERLKHAQTSGSAPVSSVRHTAGARTSQRNITIINYGIIIIIDLLENNL